jgi:uncharacterized membrane protein
MGVALPPTGQEPGAESRWIGLPKTSGETTTVVAHFHRAEVARMAGWRDRIDRTTNWAITVIAAMLSVSLSAPAAHHSVLLFAMLLVLLLLAIEARRYRFFDVYRGRVRRLERYYYAQIFAPEPGEAGAWARDLAADLRQPVFRVGFTDAMTRRLRRNYIWIFLILLLAWVLKVMTLLPGTAVKDEWVVLDLRAAVGNAALGPLSGWVVIGIVAAFHGVMIGLSLRRPHRQAEDGTVHV